MTLPEFAIKRPITAMVILITIFIMGAIALTRLPLAFMPEFEQKRLVVIVNYPNASPKIVERFIVRPIEESLSPINGLKHINSGCDADGGRVSLFFDYSVDMDLVRSEVRERIDRIRSELPDDIERILISSHWNARVSGEAIMEARISSGRDLSRDYELLKRRIIKPLERIPGVAGVELDGVNPREVKINLQLDALKRHQIDIRDVVNALNRNNVDQSLGVVRTSQIRYTLRTKGAFQNLEEIRDLPITRDIRLKDLAEITYREPPLEYGRHLDGKFAVGLNVTQESSANTVEVCKAIRERVEEMNNDPELEGIHFLVWADQGKEIENSIHDLERTGFIGALLASVILFLFLKRFSSTFISVACIPLSLLVACGVIWAAGKTLNTLSLLGLIVGIGMLVDNAVVLMENIVRYQQEGYSAKKASLIGSREVSIAVIAATMTSVIVFLPMVFSKPSEMNLIMKELALTVCYTLLASLFISQTLIPLAMSHLPRKKRKVTMGPIMTWAKERYGRLLGWTLRHRYVAPLVGFAVIGSLWFPFNGLNFNFDTNSTDMFVQIRYNFSENPPLEKKEEIVAQVEKELEPLRDDYQIDSIYSFWSERWTLTRLYMKEGFAHEDHLNRVRQLLADHLPEIPGVKIRAEDNSESWHRNQGNRIGFRLEGPDFEVLSRISEEALGRIETIPGLFDFNSTSEGESTELHSIIDRDKARAYGVSAYQSSQVVELTFRGRRLPRFKDGDTEVEMRLTLDEKQEESVEQLKSLPLMKSDQTSIPLETMATFKEFKSPQSIRRSDKVSGIWIGAKFSGGDKEAYRTQMISALKNIRVPFGYRWDFEVRNRDAEESKAEFITNLLLALGLIFALMAGLFESSRQALSLMVSLPFAVTGAFWMLYALNTDFDRPASIGLLLLLGIVVNNGIVMVEHINMYRRQGIPREEAMIRGGKERFRPVMMTAMTTLIGLLPIAIDKPALAGVYYYSMAYVIMGGLILSTILTTILLPTTICITEDIMGWIGRLARIPFKRSIQTKELETS